MSCGCGCCAFVGRFECVVDLLHQAFEQRICPRFRFHLHPCHRSAQKLRELRLYTGYVFPHLTSQRLHSFSRATSGGRCNEASTGLRHSIFDDLQESILLDPDIGLQVCFPFLCGRQASVVGLLFIQAYDWPGGFPTHPRPWNFIQRRPLTTFSAGWHARQQGAGDNVGVLLLGSICAFE